MRGDAERVRVRVCVREVSNRFDACRLVASSLQGWRLDTGPVFTDYYIPSEYDGLLRTNA
jgi:hypothetical protein